MARTRATAKKATANALHLQLQQQVPAAESAPGPSKFPQADKVVTKEHEPEPEPETAGNGSNGDNLVQAEAMATSANSNAGLPNTSTEGDKTGKKTIKARKQPAKRALKEGDDSSKPNKRARKSRAKQVRGGWDVLPHNLGTLAAPGAGSSTAPITDIVTEDKLNNGDAAVGSDEGTQKQTAAPTESEEAKDPRSSTQNSDGASVVDRAILVGTLSDPATSVLVLNSKDGASFVEAVGQAILGLPTFDDGKTVEELAIMMKPIIRKRTENNPDGLIFGRALYPNWPGPSPEACEEVHRILTEMHGVVKAPETIPPPSLTVAGCGEVPSVLDALMRTMLSASVSMEVANVLVASLAEQFGVATTGSGKGSVNWENVRNTSREELADTIRRGGLQNTKAGHMKAVLDSVYKDQMSLNLDYLHGKTAQEAMLELVRFDGVSVKTAACVILFCLRVPCFAVDTHVGRFCRWLKWVPPKATEVNTFFQCEYYVPDHLKYGLHQLFIRHGQTCHRCSANTVEGTDGWNKSTCPLEHFLKRDKRQVKPKDDKEIKSEDDEMERSPKPKRNKRQPKQRKAKKEEDEEAPIKEENREDNLMVEAGKDDSSQTAGDVAV